MSRVDDMVHRILRTAFAAGVIARRYVTQTVSRSRPLSRIVSAFLFMRPPKRWNGDCVKSAAT